MNKAARLISGVTMKRMVHGGQCITHDPISGKPVFAWNALPDERVDIRVTRKNAKMIEGVAEQIHAPSLLRIQPKEDHWLSCSPWQIISQETERQFKIDAAREILTHDNVLSETELRYVDTPATELYGYRNKMEWSFTAQDTGEVCFAFFMRGGHHKVPASNCALASPAIMAVSNEILAWIREQSIPLRSLKTLIVRSNASGQVIAGLFIKDRLVFDTYPKLSSQLIGFSLYYSSHKSPASVIHDVLKTLGTMTLTQTVCGVSISHGIESFFQVNIPIFERALADLMRNVPPTLPIVDYYSGVGTIGLVLAERMNQSAICIESNAEAAEYASRNSSESRQQITTHCSPAERMMDWISPDSLLIVDPPRAGLHADMVQKIIDTRVPHIAYLSCNISTQARDLKLLSAEYSIDFASLYNFFPRTPHIESLCILRKR